MTATPKTRRAGTAVVIGFAPIDDLDAVPDKSVIAILRDFPDPPKSTENVVAYDKQCMGHLATFVVRHANGSTKLESHTMAHTLTERALIAVALKDERNKWFLITFHDSNYEVEP